MVPAGKVWVMGDNRNHSADSRAHMEVNGGFIDIADIEGKAGGDRLAAEQASPPLGNYPDVFRDVPAADGGNRPAVSAAPTLDYERRLP